MKPDTASDCGSPEEVRLDVRLTREQKTLIERAAKLQGTATIGFVVASAQKAAMEVVENHRFLRLHYAARDVFVNAVLNPAGPNEFARKAAQRYKEHMGL